MRTFDHPLATRTLAIVRMECFVLGEHGQYVNHGGFIPFVDSLAPYFKRIEVAAPVVTGLPVSSGVSTFQAPNVIFRPLPNLKGLVRCWSRGGRAARLLDQWSEGWDLVNLRAPDNFLPIALRYVRQRNLTHYVQLVSHPGEVENTAIGNLRPALRAVGRRLWRVQRKAIKEACSGSFCIAHGSRPAAMAKSWGATAVNLPSGSLSTADLPVQPKRERPRQLLFVGRLDAEKGLNVLLDALPSLADLHLELVIAGWSTKDMEQRLREQAQQLGVAPKVRFHGPVAHGPELFELYRGADVFVLPSISEGTPRVLGEAMAFGLPVVSTRAGGIPDIVKDGRSGLLVQAGSAPELSAAIRRIVEDASLRESLVQAANADLHERTLEHVACEHVRSLSQHIGEAHLSQRRRGAA